MKKTTQKTIKNMIQAGIARRVTECAQIAENYNCLAYSVGIYGINGLILRGESGQLYAIPSRCTALFFYL